MKHLLIPVLFASAGLSAQKKAEKKAAPEMDSAKISKLNTKDFLPQKKEKKDLYKMPSAKPKEGTQYSSLKDKRTDNRDYKMLNSTPPEIPKKQEEVKLAPPAEK